MDDIVKEKLVWGANGEFSAMIKPEECQDILREHAAVEHQLLQVVLPALRIIRDGCDDPKAVASAALGEAAAGPIPGQISIGALALGSQ